MGACQSYDESTLVYEPTPATPVYGTDVEKFQPMLVDEENNQQTVWTNRLNTANTLMSPIPPEDSKSEKYGMLMGVGGVVIPTV